MICCISFDSVKKCFGVLVGFLSSLVLGHIAEAKEEL